MPGAVVAATASVVMPLSLSSLFEEQRTVEIFENEYAGGESQRRQRAATSRKSWRLAKRCSAAEMATLEAFIVARQGGLGAFYFYNGPETVPIWAWDPTGVSTVGRYVVRFANARFLKALNIARATMDLELVEVA